MSAFGWLDHLLYDERDVEDESPVVRPEPYYGGDGA